jgi:hypothetical protein
MKTTENIESSGVGDDDERIQEWLSAPDTAKSEDATRVSIRQTQTNCDEPMKQESSCTFGSASVVPLVSRIPKGQLNRKRDPGKLPKVPTIEVPNAADCKSTHEAAKAAITSLISLQAVRKNSDR